MEKTISENFYYQQLLPEINFIQRQVVTKLEEYPELKKCYNGWKVWFSPIIDNPKILFIGINPNNVEEDEADVEPDGQLQYIYDECTTWGLKNDTLDVFYDERISCKIDLDDCVKTNYYYLATTNYPGDFYKLVNCLGRQHDKQGLGDIFLEKSKVWTRRMIQIMKPKIIICEGVSAFDLVTEYALERRVSREDSDVFTYFDERQQAYVIGYRRSHPQAGIKNKELLIEHIARLLN